ncbi:hypothetical protein [Dongia sedimenti]|uniref:Acyl-CoA synthetase n=1 Tax=Dongia sedimenti TaxID=3064282 RepID=A0ABU0YFN6_9PROT|nr:hypothetical protein [Rhodospirillaceae bacterium R-7]
MAASNAAAKPAAPQAPKKQRPWLLISLVMPVALLLLPSTLVLIPAMVPTLVARVVDPAPGRHLTITVGSLNFAGALWFMHDLWSEGQSFSAILPTLGDMLGWLAALVGAGSGWAIYSLMPIVSRSIATAKSNLRLNRVRKAQEALVEEWGDPVRGGHTLPAVPGQE